MITIDNVYARTEVGSPEFNAIARILRFRKKGYVFSEAYQKRHWDGFINLMSTAGRFPAGLLPYTLVRLRTAGLAPEISDTRVRPPPCDALRSASLSVALMPHQQAAVDAAYEAGQGLIEHAVAAGKTLTLIELVRRCAVPALVLTHRKDLLYQIVGSEHPKPGEPIGFRQALDIPGLVGIIGDGRAEPSWITVATFQSISAMLRNYPDDAKALMAKVQAVLVDEAAHLVAKTYEQVMKLATNAFYRFGCSATVYKMGDAEATFKVQAWTGPIVSRCTPQEAIKIGRLVPAEVFVVDYGAEDNGLPWPRQYEVGVVGHAKRNALIAQIAEGAPKPVLVLIERIDHGSRLAYALAATNLIVGYIHGTNSSTFRADQLDLFRDGRLDILISSVILDEGIDVPNIRTLILAGGGKAPHKVIQRIGRGQRSHEGKGKLLVFDFADVGRNIGTHARARARVYEREPSYRLNRIEAKELLEELHG